MKYSLRSLMGEQGAFWLGFATFFGIGVAIAVVIAMPLIDQGIPFVFAVCEASVIGGFGAWLSFVVPYHFLRLVGVIKKTPNSSAPTPNPHKDYKD